MSNDPRQTQEVTILLAEDDDGHATLVERNLRRAGLDNGFIRFRDGQETLDHLLGPAATAIESCVLLLDIKMPRVDGIEVLRRLRADPKTDVVPVIMLTTTDDPREVEHCYDLGCNAYITKPVEYERFIDAVKRLGFFLQIVKLPSRRPGASPPP